MSANSDATTTEVRETLTYEAFEVARGDAVSILIGGGRADHYSGVLVGTLGA